MTASLPTFQDVLVARRTIAPYLAPTPLHHYPQLDQLLDAHVYVKHENYQPIGAFKVRGGINYLAHLPADQRGRGVATASNGCAGMSAARLLHLADQGSTTGTFRSEKCRTLRVAIVARRASAMPAICVSRMSTGRPAR